MRLDCRQAHDRIDILEALDMGDDDRCMYKVLAGSTGNIVCDYILYLFGISVGCLSEECCENARKSPFKSLNLDHLELVVGNSSVAGIYSVLIPN